jgi:hypothetical protein
MLIFKDVNGDTKRGLPLKSGSRTVETAIETHSPKAGIRLFQSVKQGIFMECSIPNRPFFEKIRFTNPCAIPEMAKIPNFRTVRLSDSKYVN